MACPADITGYSTNAKWTMNHKLSEPSDDILSAQGVGYLKRKAIGMATVSVTNTTTVVDGVTVVKSSSSASGIPGAQEEVHLNGQPKASDHSIYGKILTTGAAKKPEEISDKYLTENMLPDSLDSEGRMFYVSSQSDKSAGNKYDWTAEVTSGYQNVDVGGKTEKRWVRLNHFKDNKGFEKRIRLVYDFVSRA